jgi:hypothetical protein
MKEIYSKVKDGVLLHIFHKKEEIVDMRRDLISSEEFLQVSTLKLPKDKTFKPHKHIDIDKHVTTTIWMIK